MFKDLNMFTFRVIEGDVQVNIVHLSRINVTTKNAKFTLILAPISWTKGSNDLLLVTLVGLTLVIRHELENLAVNKLYLAIYSKYSVNY